MELEHLSLPLVDRGHACPLPYTLPLEVSSLALLHCEHVTCESSSGL